VVHADHLGLRKGPGQLIGHLAVTAAGSRSRPDPARHLASGGALSSGAKEPSAGLFASLGGHGGFLGQLLDQAEQAEPGVADHDVETSAFDGSDREHFPGLVGKTPVPRRN
jgi:hypothetical protein